MGQAEVINFLKRNPGKWYTSKVITRYVRGSGISATTIALMRLRRTSFLKFRLQKTSKNRQSFEYMYRK